MRVSVVIPTRNRRKDLNRCLDALSKQTATPAEILILNNGAPFDSSFYRDWNNAKVLDSTGILSFLFNLGWKKSSGDIVAYLNDDSEPDEGWVEGIKDGFTRFPDAAAVGGPTQDLHLRSMSQLYRRGSLPVKMAFAIYERAFLNGSFLEVGKIGKWGAFSVGTWDPPSEIVGPIPVDHLTITNVAFQKSVLEALGGFDENFLYCHIDGDFFVRLKRSGYLQIYHPGVKVKHHVAPDGATRDTYFLSRDSAYFLVKNFRPAKITDAIGFVVQVIFMNGFFLHSAVSTGSSRQLKGMFGFVRGFVKGFAH